MDNVKCDACGNETDLRPCKVMLKKTNVADKEMLCIDCRLRMRLAGLRVEEVHESKG